MITEIANVYQFLVRQNSMYQCLLKLPLNAVIVILNSVCIHYHLEFRT